MSGRPVIVWLRQDLRLEDHRALGAAIATGAPVVMAYVLDRETAAPWAPGAASLWWLHNSLEALSAAVRKIGGVVILRRGRFRDELLRLADEAKAQAVFCSRSYEPWAGELERTLAKELPANGVAFKRFGGTLLREPEDVKTQNGDFYRVYTPFWRSLAALGDPHAPSPAPKAIASPKTLPKSDRLADWALPPSKPDWAKGMAAAWTPGEAGAHENLAAFLDTAIHGYKTRRDRPGEPGTSRLSPHLHFGEVTPAQCWRAAKAAASRLGDAETGLETFLKEIAWREFSYHLLFHVPHLPEKAFRPEFERFPFVKDKARLRAWRKGRTGYPLVDAGMRQLWETGWMHNRVRMVVASFLIKHLLISWKEGERWFWDTLVDADLASNAASWQWVAGSGADAAPYFRIFNPVKQGKDFDPNGDYVRRWVPELATLPASAIHAPWDAGPEELHDAGVVLGETYPKPIVDHAEARRRALAAYDDIKG